MDTYRVGEFAEANPGLFAWLFGAAAEEMLGGELLTEERYESAQHRYMKVKAVTTSTIAAPSPAPRAPFIPEVRDRCATALATIMQAA